MRQPNSLLRVRALFCLLGVSESALIPFVPLVLRARGLDPQALGAMLALLAAVAFTVGPLWGLVADRVLGYERTLQISLAGTAVASLGFAVSHSVVALALAGSLLWAIRTPNMAMADSMALVRLGPERRDAYGGVRLWMSAGFALGAVVFGVLVDAVGLDLVAPLYGGLCAFNAVAFALALRGRRLGPTLPRDRAVRGPRLPLRSLPALAVFLVALFLANASYSAAYSFVAVRIAALGGGAVFVGLAACLQAATEVPSMAWTRRLSQRLHPGSVFAAGAVVYTLVNVAWAFVASPAAIASLRLVAGVGFALTYVGTVLVVDELVPERFRATGQASAKAVSGGLAPVAGSLGGGLVYGYLGPSPFFLVAAAATAVAAVVARRAESTRPAPTPAAPEGA